jgi:hypothetical protein
MRHMVIIVPELTGYASIRHIAVSLAHMPALVDGVKYMEPRDVPRLEGTELRRARAPSLRFLVKQALKCQSAEEARQETAPALPAPAAPGNAPDWPQPRQAQVRRRTRQAARARLTRPHCT